LLGLPFDALVAESRFRRELAPRSSRSTVAVKVRSGDAGLRHYAVRELRLCAFAGINVENSQRRR